MIDRLVKSKDRLISELYKDELIPIQTDNRFHSPEVSETDNDDPNSRKVVIRDLKWRSSTVNVLCFLFILQISSNRYLPLTFFL
jgi:hypothetical protein